jgi:hypothetical protein
MHALACRLFGVAVVLSFCRPVAAQELDRTVTITGSATLRGHADYAVVTLRHQVIAKDTSANALATCRKVTKKAFAALAKEGVKSTDVATLDLALDTVVEERTGEPPRILGYRAVQTFQVFIRDLKRVADLTQVVLDAGVAEVVSTHYRTSQPTAFREHARRLALADVMDKAKFIEEALKSKLSMRKIEQLDISFSDVPWSTGGFGGDSRAGHEAYLSGTEATAWDYGVSIPDLGGRVDSETASMIRVTAQITALFSLRE